MSSLLEIVKAIGDGGATVLVDASIKSAVVLLAAAITARALCGASAAVRHRVWSLALGGTLLMPVLSITVPQMRLPVLPVSAERSERTLVPAAATNSHRSVAKSDNSTRDREMESEQAEIAALAVRVVENERAEGFNEFSGTSGTPIVSNRSQALDTVGETAVGQHFRVVAFGVWVAGLLVVLAPLMAGFGAHRLLLRRSRRLKNGRWVRLIADLSARIGLNRVVAAFESPQPVVPMTWGFLRPTVLVPVTWRDWSEERRRCVLLHELAHVKRLDVVFQIIGRLAVGFHWFNPLAWYALRQLRVERELACDDCVLASGERASDYARELVQIAKLYRPRRLAVGVAMAQSARLDQRVLGILDNARSRLPVSPKLASCLVVVATALVLVVAATSLVERSATAAAKQIPSGPSTPTPVPNPEDTGKVSKDRVTVTGVVVAPDGKPVPGAHVYAHDVTRSSSRMGNEIVRTLAQTTTENDGTFSLEYAKPEQTDPRGINQSARTHRGAQFVATADGHAVGFWSDISFGRWSYGQSHRYDPIRIQLAREESLSGRLIDLEGRPLANAKVEVKAIAQASEALDEWFKSAAGNPHPGAQIMASMKSLQDRPQPVRFPSTAGFAATGTIPPVMTDRQGRFSISSIGADRLVALEVTSPTIAKTIVKMVSHRGPDVFDSYPDPRVRDSMIHGAGATVAIEPAIAIKGQVVDANNGAPISGCHVEVAQVAGSPMALEDFASTKTDDSGRYVLGQLPPDPPNSRGYQIRFTPPAGLPYFSTDYVVRIGGDAQEKIFDVHLPRTRLISGRVTDNRTGQPVRALVGYLPTLDNQLAANYPNFDAGMHTLAYEDFRWNEPDGSFLVPAIHGRGVLCVTAERMAAYGLAGQADRIEGLQRERDESGLYHLFGTYMVNEFREVNLGQGDADPTIDVALRALSQRAVRLVDTDGKPVIGCCATGQMPDVAMAARQPLSSYPPLESAETEVVGLEVESPRVLAFHQPKRNIGATIVMRESDPHDEPLTITLQTGGRIRGRLLDESGQPVSGVQVHGTGLPPVDLPKPKHQFRPASFGVYTEVVQSNVDGSFVIEHVVPGVRYKVMILDGKLPKERPASMPPPPEPSTKETQIVEPGQTVDVGDWKPAGDQTVVSAPKAPEVGTEKDGKADRSLAASSQPSAPITVQGRVLDADGKPVAGAKIHILPAFPGSRSESERGPRLVATANESGEFQFADGGDLMDGSSGRQIVVTAAGHGLEWLPLSDAIERRTITVSLAKDLPVLGRILTLEGQPVVGAKISVHSIRAMHNGDLTAYIETVKAGNGSNFRFDKYIFEPPHIASPTTDAEGRFRLSGIGQNRIADLEVVGRAIQHATLRVMTLDSQPIRARAGRRFAEMEKEMGTPPVFGASFEWLARPSRPIIGTIIDGKTGRPLGGARVSSLGESHATTDANGRFELIGCAKAKNYRLLVSAEDQPYLLASKYVSDTPGLEPLEVTLKMTQGIAVTGRVTDRATGKPVAARLVYYPLHPNGNLLPGIGGSEARAAGAFCERQTGKDGEFSIAVLPGPGFIGVISQDRNGHQPADVDVIAFFKKENVPYATDLPGMKRSMLLVAGGGGSRSAMPQSNFHAIELLNLPPGKDDSIRREIQLRATNKVTGVVLGPDGKPIEGTSAFGLAEDYFGSSKLVSGSEFVVTALGDSETRPLLFRHEARRLVGVADVTAKMQQPIRITLQPWGEATGRLVDKEGQPLANLEIGTIGPAKKGETLGHLPRLHSTDDQGRFHIDGLVPGLTYKIQSTEDVEHEMRIVVKPGEKLDVGDVSGVYNSATEAKPKSPD